MIKLKLLFLCLVISTCYGANILLHYCPYGKTHFLSFLPLMEQLGKDGHNVTISYIDTKPPPELPKNVRAIYANIPRDESFVTSFMTILWTQTGHGHLIPFINYMSKDGLYDLLVKSNNTYFGTLSSEYDLVLVDELFTLQGILSAETLNKLYGTAWAVYSPTLQTYSYQSSTALSRNFVQSVSLFGPLPTSKTDYFHPSEFYDRLISFLENYAEIFLQRYLINPILDYKFPAIDTARFYRESYLSIGEHIDRLGTPVTEANDLVLVGSNCKSASKVINSTLPKEWDDFINDPKSLGTIYISFGSTVFWDYVPQFISDAFISAVNELDEYRIIFSWNGKFPTNAKAHVKFTKWAPQMAILSHPKTKLFVTHGGLKSLKEAICAEKPIVLMPLLAEQAHNAKFCLKLKMGLVLNKFVLTANSIVEAIREVAADDQYLHRIKHLKQLYLDRPIDPRKFGSHKISKLLRQRKQYGIIAYDLMHDSLMRRKGRLLNDLQFFGLDLILAIFGFIFLVSK